MTAPALQNEYSINPDIGDVGNIAEPNVPTIIDSGVIHVPSGAARMPRPGDALYYDSGEDAWAIPTSAAQSLLVSAILTYRQDVVQNADKQLEFSDGDDIEFCVVGSIWLIAGGGIERNSLITWDRSDYKWNALAAPAAFADLVNNPIYNASRGTAADNTLFKARIGLGRVL